MLCMRHFRSACLPACLLGALLAAAVVHADAITDWTAGPQAALDNSTYAGFIDAPANNSTVSTGGFTVNGWFVDRSAQGWAGADDVQVFLGTMDGGGRVLAKASFAQARPDVGTALGNGFWAASGFNAFIPAGAVPTGQQTLSVYVHTPGKGWWYKQVQVNASTSAPAATAPTTPGTSSSLPTIVILSPKPGEKIETSGDFDITGYALDRSATVNQGVQGTGIDRVSVYFDAEKENGGTFLGDAELAFSSTEAQATYGSQFAAAGWHLVFKPTNFHAEGHELFVYAHSVVSGKEDFVTVGFDIVEPKKEGQGN
jgi:hypothetical protein